MRDVVDKKIALLRELRNLYNTDREWYNKIKALPMKSRVLRDTGKHSDTTIVYVSTKVKSEFYKVMAERNPEPLDFIQAVDYLKAKPEEMSVPFGSSSTMLTESQQGNEGNHYVHVNRAINKFMEDLQSQTDTDSIKNANLDKTAQTADKFLRTVTQVCPEDTALIRDCGILCNYLKEGTYARLPRELKTLSKEYKNDGAKIKALVRVLADRISKLVAEYHNASASISEAAEVGTPSIEISETFI